MVDQTLPPGIPGILPEAANFYMNLPMPFAPSFSRVAGFTPLQMQGWQTALGANQNALQAARGVQGNIADLYGGMTGPGGLLGDNNMGLNMGLVEQLGGLNDPLQYNPSMDFFNNPHMAAAVEGATGALSRNFQQNVLPSISSGFAGPSGGFGSSRQGIAEGIAASNLNQQVGDISSQMYGNMYQQGLNAYGQDMATQLQAQLGARGQALDAAAQAAAQQQANWATGLGALPMLNELYMQPYGMQGQLAQNMLNIGGQQQALNQQRLVEAGQDYMQNLNAPWQSLGLYNQFVTGMPLGNFGYSYNTGVQDNPLFQNPSLYMPQVAGVAPPQASGIQNALGLLGTGVGIYNAGTQAGLWGSVAGAGAA